MPASASPLSPEPHATKAARRAALFRETAIERIERVVLGIARTLKLPHRRELPPLARLWFSELVAPRPGLPDPELTQDESEFAGMVHDLSVQTLVEAYQRGLFPSAHFGPLKWRSLAQRSVLFFDEFHIAKRLRRTMRQDHYSVTFDRDFEGVITACAGRREGRWHITWITPRIMHAYAELFDAGHVHSF